MGLIWLDHPVVWHSSRIPSGYDYSMMTVEERALMESKWHNWYSADWDYGQTTLAFFCTGIAIVSLFKIILRLRGRRPSASRPPTALDRIVAACRYSTSRQFHVQKFHWYSPPLGVVVALGGIFMFLMALMLSARPYDWSNHAMGHSPPLATRAGWISIAIMPFMIVFATKVNFIGLLTGVSHEKLQVFHRWSAFFMYITSLVHTFPFIIKSIDLGEMELVWATSSFYWTGVAALVPQTYLVLLSWGFFRNRYYEIFKTLHYVAASIFMAALFIHVDFILTSWDYFWAVVGLYGVSWLTRILRTHYNSGVGIPATVQTLPGDIIKVSIQAPKRLRWSPGQHVFVRFVNLGVDFFSSHPFTVASIPQGDGHTIDLVLKVKKGITRKLAKVADGKAAHATNVLVDGPYGGLPFSLKDFHTVFLLAGGSGASFTVPLLLDLVKGFEGGMACARIEFIVAVKTIESGLWMKGDLDNARRLAGDKVHIRICVTGEPANEDNDSSSIVTEEKMEPHLGRPDLPQIIEEACRGATGRIAFAACGPESLLYDVRNAVAECQLAIADGFGTAREVYLHTENFVW